MKTTLLLLASSIIGVNAASVSLLSPKDVTAFSHHYTGDQIYTNGGGFQNGWTGNAAVVSTTGTVVNLTNPIPSPASNNLGGTSSTPVGGGATTWNSAISVYGDAFTTESRFQMHSNDATNNGWNIWMGSGTQRDSVAVYEDRMTITQVGGGFTDVIHDFTSGFNTVRIARDGSAGNLEIMHVWLNGTQLTQDAGNPQTTSSDSSVFIYGDTTSGALGDGIDVDFQYISYDVTGAFTPIPEPTTSALFGLGALGLILRRRK